MHRILCLILGCGLAVGAAGVYCMELELKEHADGLYGLGETITCRARLVKDGVPQKNGEKCACEIKFNTHDVKRVEFAADGEFHQIDYKPSQCGWTLFCFAYSGVKPAAPYVLFTEKWAIGAMTEGEQIRPVTECPADFLEYWQRFRNIEEALPLEPKLSPVEVPEKYKDKVELFDVTLNSTTDHPVTGYLAVPKQHDGKLKALVELQCFMFVDANKDTALRYAAKGLLVFSATWHGLPCGMPQKFYDEATKTYWKGDPQKIFFDGLDVPGKWMFHGTYLRVFRILQYIKSRSEWDGRNLAVMGGSLGGIQSTVATLDKDVKLALVVIPAFNELDSWLTGRYTNIPVKDMQKILADKPEIVKNAAYYDGVNFGRFMTCEVYFATGFIDSLCPPCTVYACYNSVPASTRKAICTHPQGGHGGLTSNPKGDKRLEEYCRQ